MYDGSGGSGALRFEVRRGGVHGEDDLQLKVILPNDDELETLRIDREDPIEQVYTLVNGLTLTLGPGDLLEDDVFTVQIFDAVGSAVDPTKPFDGVRNDNPNFEPGVAVSAGSFEVNGVQIAVAADDTILAVLARVTASAAGVTASFDAASETVVLTQKTPGSAPTIALANDTSGFLAATKLDTALPVPGQDGDDPLDEVIAAVPALSTVSNGTLLVNGVGISVDIDADSLSDVIDRINQSSAGATATYDPATLRLRIVSDDPSAELVLADPTTGLLDAVRIAPGTYGPASERAAPRARLRAPDQVAEHLRETRRNLETLLRGSFAGFARDDLDEYRGELRGAIESAFAATVGKAKIPILRSGLGIDFDFSRGEGPTVEYHADKFARAVRFKAASLDAFLFQGGAESEHGLVPSLLAAVQRLQLRVAGELGTLRATGSIVDLSA